MNLTAYSYLVQKLRMGRVIPPNHRPHGVHRHNFAFTAICTLLVILISVVVRKLHNRGVSGKDKRILVEANIHHANRCYWPKGKLLHNKITGIIPSNSFIINKVLIIDCLSKILYNFSTPFATLKKKFTLKW